MKRGRAGTGVRSRRKDEEEEVEGGRSVWRRGRRVKWVFGGWEEEGEGEGEGVFVKVFREDVCIV